MKGLSLWAPWSQLVVIGAKKYETRSWKTAYRGPVAIHAAKFYPEEHQDLCRTEPFRSALLGAHFIYSTISLGAFVGLVDLVEIYPTDEIRVKLLQSDLSEIAFGDYSPGRYAWEFANPRLINPLASRGQRGLWQLDGLLATQLLERIIPTPRRYITNDPY